MDISLINTIEDERAITHLLTEYCLALDSMDLESIAGVFTEDCVIEFGPDERLNSRGRKQVAKSLERMWRWARTSHHLSNVKIRFEGLTELFQPATYWRGTKGQTRQLLRSMVSTMMNYLEKPMDGVSEKERCT